MRFAPAAKSVIGESEWESRPLLRKGTGHPIIYLKDRYIKGWLAAGCIESFYASEPQLIRKGRWKLAFPEKIERYFRWVVDGSEQVLCPQYCQGLIKREVIPVFTFLLVVWSYHVTAHVRLARDIQAQGVLAAQPAGCGKPRQLRVDLRLKPPDHFPRC